MNKSLLRKRNHILLGGLALVIAGFLALMFFRSQQQKLAGVPLQSDSPSFADILTRPAVSPEVSPLPFIEITIPHLKQREITSSLNQLTKVGENQAYTSYLTSNDSDGIKVNGLLTKPTGDIPSGGWPGIVFVHGYIPPQEYQTQVNYSSYVDYLAKNGFVVFKIDLRGHGFSEGEPGGAYYSEDYVVDTLSARAALAASGFVDPRKIGFWGHSMAGNVVFRAFVAAQNIPAVVIWAGAVYTYVDFSEYSIEDDSYRPPPASSERAKKRRELFDTYGQFDPRSDFWRQVVPTNYLESVTGAIQIHHATNDPVVDIRYSRNLMQILDGMGIIHELNEYTSGGHNLIGSTFTVAMNQTVTFFKTHLK